MVILFDVPIATITVYAEASGEPSEVRRGVAHAIVNRFNDGRFGVTLAEVCLRRLQFSCWNSDAADRANLLRIFAAAAGDPVVADCQTAVQEAITGGNDPTNGATHYHDTGIAPPDWTVGATRTVKLGRLIFYKNVR